MLICSCNGTKHIKIKFCLTKLNNNKYDYNLYKRHSAVFITKQTVLIQSNTIHALFNSVRYR